MVFRLRQEDNDGTTSYSNIAPVTVGCSNAVLSYKAQSCERSAVFRWH